MLAEAIAASQVDAKSPVDDQLMHAIKADLDDLDTRVVGIGVSFYQWKVNGPLDQLPGGKLKRADAAYIADSQTFTKCKLYLEDPGTPTNGSTAGGGTLDIDLRKMTSPQSAIIAITAQFTAGITSIARAGSSLNTQNITLTTPVINTQSIAKAKTQLNVQSILALGGGLVRYNLNTAPDSDWKIGKSVTFASCTDAGNNGTFVIYRINDDGYPCVIVTNGGSPVDQSGVAGTADVQLYKYTFTNPVSSEFTVGEQVKFGAHTAGADDGNFEIAKRNSGGNNIWVYNASGVEQAGVAGTATVNRFSYGLLSAAAADYVVGEALLAAAHTSGVNDGSLTITAVNASGNNVQVYNPSGTTQGGVAGTINTQRWVYAFASDPASSFSVGHNVVFASTTSANNSGTFAVKQVDRGGGGNLNLVAYNTAGVAQGGAAGTATHTRKLVKFASDQSAFYTTDSLVELVNVVDTSYLSTEPNNFGFTVLEVNRGGGSNYNIVIENASGLAQVGAAGNVAIESKSIFTTRPTIVVPENNQSSLPISTSGFVYANSGVVAASSKIGLYINSVPLGASETIMVQVA